MLGPGGRHQGALSKGLKAWFAAEASAGEEEDMPALALQAEG